MVVIAEGAEDGLLPEERTKIRQNLGIQEDIKDESGNVKSMVRFNIRNFFNTFYRIWVPISKVMWLNMQLKITILS